MDTFSDLPTEIILQILHVTPDFLSLDHLLTASPRASDIFNRHAPSILESVLGLCPSTSFELHLLFRSVALTRGGSKSYLVLQDFIGDCVQGDQAATPFPALDIASPVLRDMVQIAANIHEVACACLRTLLDRLRTITQADPDHHLPPQEPPSWMEEYRIHRALWHLQLFWDLHDRYSPPHPPAISTYSLRVGIDHAWIQDEIHCVEWCLRSLLSLPLPLPSSPHGDMLPVPAATSLPDGSRVVWPMPPVPDNSGRDLFKSRPRSWVNLGGSAYYIWRTSVDIDPAFGGETHATAFLAFRKIALWIWDRERVASLGMDVQERSESGEASPGEIQRLEDRWWEVARSADRMA